MDHRSRSLVRDLYLGVAEHLPLRIADLTHDAARTHGLSQQQWRTENEAYGGEERDSRSPTTKTIEAQDCEPRIRNIHRTFLSPQIQALDGQSLFRWNLRGYQTCHQSSRRSHGTSGLLITDHWPLTTASRSRTSLCNNQPGVSRGKPPHPRARKLPPECGGTASSTYVATDNR